MDMRRRAFLGLAGSAFAMVASAQGRIYRIGFMIPAPREGLAVKELFDELRTAGFIEGQNLEIVPGGFDIRANQLKEAAALVVKAAPDVIVCGPDNYAHTLLEATRTIPILTMTEDIVAVGLAQSFARPEGNVTGISLLSTELDGKRQEILLDAVPGVRRLAALTDETATPPYHIQGMRDAARSHGVELLIFGVANPVEIITAITKAKEAGAGAINFLASPLFAVPGGPNTRDVINHVTNLSVPAIYQWPENTEEGGFMGYGPSFLQVFRQRARQVIRVLRGSRASDIPIEQPTKFELALNLKAAKAMGHEFPANLVLRADKIIE
jgi:putative ABC transport system substrate-binding protein